jgi:hypothetical protein
MDMEDVEEASLYRKRKGAYKKQKDDRETLLYELTEITPPPTKLGLFRLAPSAACGDIISARVTTEGGKKVEETFVVKRISYVYRYQGGAYRMVAKGADVKRARRELAESLLERSILKDVVPHPGATVDGVDTSGCARSGDDETQGGPGADGSGA